MSRTAKNPGAGCPKCRCTRSKVLYTRHRKDSTMRVRRCVGCGHRYRTVDRVESNAT